MRVDSTKEVAFVYGVAAGVGGLGIQSANAAAALASPATEIHAFGPGHTNRWPLSPENKGIFWHEIPPRASSFMQRYSWRRWFPGRSQFRNDVRLGNWAAQKISRRGPHSCYVFTQVGLEVLEWAKQNGIPTVLESPNGHIRDFRKVYEREVGCWCGAKFRGHPTLKMVERVEREYELADRIRVSSEWSKESLIAGGVPAGKISVLQQPVNVVHFQPSPDPSAREGPLRLCFVGSVDFRKGFVYLLRAMRLVGSQRVSLQIVGATGSRCCSRLFARESQGLNIISAPGDPLPAYHRAEVFVLPTLEDGSPFAAAEAMSCGLPVITTDSCGAAEWVASSQSGWIVPSRNPEALAEAIETALSRRRDLKAMRELARSHTERRAGAGCFEAFREWHNNEMSA